MNLAQRYERPGFPAFRRADLLQEELAIALDRRARVVLRESEIQRVSPIDARNPSVPC